MVLSYNTVITIFSAILILLFYCKTTIFYRDINLIILVEPSLVIDSIA